MRIVTHSDEQIVFLKTLYSYYIHPRYPDLMYAPLPKIDFEISRTLLEKTNDFFSMAQSTDVALRKDIVEHYIDVISREVKVDGVLLFGSFAYGHPT